MTKAYSVFANEGYLVEPIFITKDRRSRRQRDRGDAASDREKVIEKSTAYIMTSLLESVVKSGTGYRVRALNRPVAGKTGTTNDLYDAWFVGYTPALRNRDLGRIRRGEIFGTGETGSRTASPIWLGFMQRVLEGQPVRVFQVPEGVVFAKIDAETGLLPIPESQKTIFECFKEGTVPTEYTKKPDTIVDAVPFSSPTCNRDLAVVVSYSALPCRRC